MLTGTNPTYDEKEKKNKKTFRSSARLGLRPVLPAYENYFSLFSFFLVPSYVGYVLASDDLGICCFVWRYEFLSKFLFVTEEKSSFRREAADLPKHVKFLQVS